MSGHTPGPWITGKTCVGIAAVFGRTGSGQAVATLGAWDSGCDAVNFENHEADARLIAAAPELLEALNSLLDCISETRGKDATDAVAKARAVKAKAEGKQ